MDTERLFCLSFLNRHPDDAARVLERLSPEVVAGLCAEIPPEITASVLDPMETAAAARVLKCLAPEQTARAVERLPVESAACLLRRFEAAAREEVLGLLSAKKLAPLKSLLNYPEDTAGGLMDPLAPTLPFDVDVVAAWGMVREQSEHVGEHLYVVDRERRLLGWVHIRQLLRAPEGASVADLANGVPPVLHPLLSGHAVLAHPAWGEWHTLAVAGMDGIFLGAIHHRIYRRLEYDYLAASRAALAHRDTGAALGELFRIGLQSLVSDFTAPGESRPTSRT